MIKIPIKDKIVLRELAKQVTEIAALPVQAEKKNQWKALNSLKPIRPMVLIDQVPWHEMDVDGELTLQCEESFCRKMETKLRRTVYSWKHMRVDMVVEPFIEIPKIINGVDLGMSVVEKKAVNDVHNDIIGHFYIDQLNTEEDLFKIKMPEIILDEVATARIAEKANDLFYGIMDIRMQGCLPGFTAWDRIAEYRGVQNILYDLADRPEFLHKIISRYTEASLSMLDQLEAKGLLGFGQSTIHCSGAYTDELPAKGFDSKHSRTKDIWTFGMAQLFATVSPTMHEEFEVNYAIKWYERFGLGYYGCCEPLHNKMKMVRKIPNLRKISMSPWVDVEKGAQEIGKDYVFSRKPNPAFLATESFDIVYAEKDLRDTITKCYRYDCPTEFILKDISTVAYRPKRLWEWAEMAKNIVEG